MRKKHLMFGFLAVLASCHGGVDSRQEPNFESTRVSMTVQQIQESLREGKEGKQLTVLSAKLTTLDLTLDYSNAMGYVYEAGAYTGVFVPILNKDGDQGGFTIYARGEWSASIEDDGTLKGLKFNEGVLVDVNLNDHYEDTQGVVETGSQPLSTSGSTYCSYVSYAGFHLGCWIPDENPFGYYYEITTRFGITPDPSSPNWWACTWGSIHVCPRYESGGSPQRWTQCGFPPLHSQGG